MSVQHRFEYDGSIMRMYGIWLVNIVLSILTLGIYSFWGKTRMRGYVAQSFKLEQDRFEYIGRGKELLFGFAKAIPIILVIYIPFAIWNPEEYPVIHLLSFLPFLYLIYLGTYSALRYRFSRTIWRGIRGKVTGSAFKFATLKIVRMLLNIITLGLLIPKSDIMIYRYLVSHMHFGNKQATFTEEPDPSLTRSNLITLLLLIPTLGFSRCWYAASLVRYQYAHTTIGNASFKATHTGKGLLWLWSINIILTIITFGLAWPVVVHRSMRYFSDHVFVIGDIETSGIQQSDESLGNSGEGLHQALDADAGSFM